VALGVAADSSFLAGSSLIGEGRFAYVINNHSILIIVALPLDHLIAWKLVSYEVGARLMLIRQASTRYKLFSVA
jgi:hypothetical protein